MRSSTLEPPAPKIEVNEAPAEQQEREALVKRIAASEVLARASQLREILLYVVHRSLHDTYPIKERDIGCDVLKRPPNFDGTVDNIVRVQVGHLRRKLDQYFAGEGKDEPLVISIPRGSYMPRFEPRSVPPVRILADAPKSYPYKYIAAGVVLLGLLTWLIFGRVHITSPKVATAASSQQHINNPILRPIFMGTNPVSVVLADTNLQLLETLLQREVTISEYSAPDYPNNLFTADMPAEKRELLRLIAVRRYTSFGDSTVMLGISQTAQQYGREIQPRYSRFINIRDLEQGNYVFIGKSPWLSLFNPKMNFVPEAHVDGSNLAIRNRSPQPGEAALYPVIGNWSTESTSYASIALIPNLAQTGYVLMLNGTGSEATEAAMSFLGRPETADKLNQILKGRELDDHSPFEILLRVHSVQGTAHDFEIVADTQQDEVVSPTKTK